MEITNYNTYDINFFLKHYENYYNNIINYGWNYVLDYYDQKCIITLFNDRMSQNVNPYDFIILLAKEGIKKGSINNMKLNAKYIDNEKLMITCIGSLSFINFIDQVISNRNFVDILIITCYNNKIIDQTFNIL